MTVNGAGEVVEVEGTEEPQQVAFAGWTAAARACIFAVALALIALQSCGAGSENDASRPGAAAAKAGSGRRAEADRDLRRPGLHRRGARVPEAPVRGRAAGQGRGPARRPPAPPPVPRHLGPGRLRRRARAALDRLPARLQADTERFYVYYTDTPGEHPGRRIQAAHRDPGGGRLAPQRDRRSRIRASPTTTAASFSSSATSSTSAPATAAPAATRRTTPRTRTSCSGSCCGSTPGPRAGGRTRSPPATRSSARPRGAARSTATACATRSASPSTPSPPARRGSRSATSARTASRSSTTPPLAGAAGANFGWDAFEGYSAYHDENSGTPDPGGTVKPIFAYPHSRDGSCSIIGGYVVRDRSLGGLYRPLRLRGPLRGQAAEPGPAPAPGERRPRARPDRRLADLVRRRRQRAGSTSPRSKGRSYQRLRPAR